MEAEPQHEDEDNSHLDSKPRLLRLCCINGQTQLPTQSALHAGPIPVEPLLNMGLDRTQRGDYRSFPTLPETAGETRVV